MTTLHTGNRIGRNGVVVLACSAVVLDSNSHVLLTRRADNGRWCLPGGHFEAGESVTEATIREVKEETGLDIEVSRLTGVYSSPHRLLEYADGNSYHVVALNFEGQVVGGVLRVSEETTSVRWCPQSELSGMDIIENHRERLEDALRGETSAYVR